MTGHLIGYIKVSTIDQNPERQLAGVEVDRTITDKASAKDTHREKLNALMAPVRTGDNFVVHGMDRSARSLDDLSRIARSTTKRDECI